MIKKFNETRRPRVDMSYEDAIKKLKNRYSQADKLSTVGQLIDHLKNYDPDTKVAINVAEEPSIIFDVQVRKAKNCTGRGDDLVFLYNLDPEEDVVLIRGNQY